jgi:hypothetical protein
MGTFHRDMAYSNNGAPQSSLTWFEYSLFRKAKNWLSLCGFCWYSVFLEIVFSHF